MNDKHSPFAFLTIHLDLAAVGLDDVVAQTQTQTGSLAGGFGGEEGLKYLVSVSLWNA